MSNIYTRVAGGVTRSQLPGENAEIAGDDFEDRDQLRDAFRDPRYQTSASFRALVAEMLAKSEIATSDASSGPARFQVSPQRAHDVPAEPNYDDAHSRAMIARAEQAGLK